MMFPTPLEGLIIPLTDCTLVVTSANYDQATGTFRIFRTSDEAIKWSHQVSLDQCPDWHYKHCPECNK
jgi:hypothetical protein